MSHIFISYSRKDIDFAGKIVEALAENELDTWIDWKSIPKGEDWEREIYRGIEEPAATNIEGLPELPDGWVWVTVGQISYLIQYGTSEKANLDSSGIPVLRMGNIQDGKIDFGNLKYLPINTPKLDELILQRNDVIFNRTNSAELVGKTAVYKESHPKSTFASYLIRVKLFDLYHPDLLAFCINSYHGRRYIASVVSQQVGQANVNGTKLANMPIPYPPLVEQHRIVGMVERRLSVADEIEKELDESLVRAERLRSAVLRSAFEGRL